MSGSMVLAMVLAVGIGLSLGLLGGGGTILAVPLLTYVAGMPAKEAIAASMFIIGVTSLVSVGMRARRGDVRWRTGLMFGAASMVGAFLGGVLGSQLLDVVLMVAFALMMVATALAMILSGGSGRRESRHARPPVLRILGEGLVVGLVTGMIGAGGGFLVVPALVLWGGLPMSAAVGTSLLIISMKSFTGLAGYLTSVSLDWAPVLMITGVTVASALLGTALVRFVPDRVLKKAFGYLVLAMGLVVFFHELPVMYGMVAAAAALGLLAVLLIRRGRSPAHAGDAGGLDEDPVHSGRERPDGSKGGKMDDVTSADS